jgi:PTS system glucitol/sorbitol-specific IIC component
MADKEYKAVTISKGKGGWGGPLTIQPTAQRDKIVAVTGGGIPPVAYRIAELTGGIAVDGFRAPPAESEMACVVVDCGGTARCGVYPRKRIPTINLTPVGQSGPLAQFITEDIYVSAVTNDTIKMADGSTPVTAAGTGGATMAAGGASASAAVSAAPAMQGSGNGFVDIIANIGRAMGRVVGIFFNAGRRTIDQVVRNVLPFMAFVTMLIGLILYTGIGDLLAKPMPV